jgi:iron complex outermembrane receptor protein
MKNYILLFILFIFSINSLTAQAILNGKVLDANSKELLIGAVVTIPDLKVGVVTDVNGVYEFKNLPSRKFLVQVRLIGYSTLTDQITISNETSKDFFLATSVIEEDEVVVTGSAFTSNSKRNYLSVVPVTSKQLKSVGAANITDALAQVPGVAGISTGSAISKPVIRGLGYNRVLTINQGLRQEGQQWGDEHGLEIDQFSADRIEILKGPASLLYGSDALGGVINILEPIPAPLGTIKGQYDVQYATNNALVVNSLMLEGNHNGIVWRGRGTFKSAASFLTPTERVYNSGFNERDANIMLGINRKWGFSHLHASIYDSNIGLVEGERDSATNQFVNVDGEIISDDEAFTRDLDLPNQNIQHLKVSLVNSFFIGKGNLRFVAGWQQNDRREFEDSQTEPGLFFRLPTTTGDLKYYFPEFKGLETVVGLSGMYQTNENLGYEYLIPNYTLNDVGGFLSLKKNLSRSTINAGMRYDTRNVVGEELKEDGDVLFESFESNFSALTGALGFTYQIDTSLNLKSSIGRGFRAPNISELAANGVHEGTFRYEIGDPNLKAETSLNYEVALDYSAKFLSASVSVFYNQISDFIYYRRSGNETIDIDQSTYPVYRFTQGDALLKGFELSVDAHIIEELHFENSFSYVDGKNQDTKIPLPFIPPFHWQSNLNYSFEKIMPNLLKGAFVKLQFDYFAKQDKIDEFETITDAAAVWGISLGSDIKIAKQWANLTVTCNNLSNTIYFNHLSRLKEIGVNAMGRNITVALNVPFGLK